MNVNLTARSMTPEEARGGLSLTSKQHESKIAVADGAGTVYETTVMGFGHEIETALMDSVKQLALQNPTLAMATGGGQASARGAGATAQGLAGGRATADGPGTKATADEHGNARALGQGSTAEANVFSAQVGGPVGFALAMAHGQGAHAISHNVGGTQAIAHASRPESRATAYSEGAGSESQATANENRFASAAALDGAVVKSSARSGDVIIHGAKPGTSVLAENFVSPETVSGEFESGERVIWGGKDKTTGLDRWNVLPME